MCQRIKITLVGCLQPPNRGARFRWPISKFDHRGHSFPAARMDSFSLSPCTGLLPFSHYEPRICRPLCSGLRGGSIPRSFPGTQPTGTIVFAFATPRDCWIPLTVVCSALGRPIYSNEHEIPGAVVLAVKLPDLCRICRLPSDAST